MISDDFAAYAVKVHLHFKKDTGPIQMTDALASAMSAIALRCAKEGTTLIGHIKAIAEIPNGSWVACSVTGLDGKARTSGELTSNADEMQIVINALQYGLKGEKLEEVVEETIKKSYGKIAKVELEELAHEHAHDHEDECSPHHH